MTTTKPSLIKRALLSVSDKEGLVLFAKSLHHLQIELVATGGTARLLREAGLPVIDVSTLTGYPEMMEGRVKTLHPAIHGGLLARRGVDDAVLKEHDLLPIDLLVVNLYPFVKTIQHPDCTREQAIENIDIGGPAMLRSAAKNHDSITVVVDPKDYGKVLKEIQATGGTTLETRKSLAQKTFAHTASYDSAIASYLSDDADQQLYLEKKLELRYGENPHQKATLYQTHKEPGSLSDAELLQGKALSFNNLMDSHAALTCVRGLGDSLPACTIVKHATPCGVAQADTLKEAYLKALSTDPVSAFGGIIAFNQNMDRETAETVLAKQFAEVIIARQFSNEALELLKTKKNLRLLATGDYQPTANGKTFHTISGGLLIQDADEAEDDEHEFTVVSKRQPTDQELADCYFAWRVVRHVKSNAIVLAKDGQTLGIGGGQTSRVFSAAIAVQKAEEAKLSLKNSVAASDAFFPFADGIEVLANAGIRSIIQPGGSVRDDEVIAAANALDLVMVLTHKRHFKH